MSKIKIKLHPRKSFLFLGRIVLTYEMDSVELNTDELTDDEIRAIISSVIGNNIECDTSISDLLSFFKDEDRKTEFYNSLVDYVKKYSAPMIRDFFEYWTEMDTKKEKMRFEDQKYFEISKRLSTWKRNSEKNEI